MKVTGKEMVRNLGRWPYKCLKHLRWLTAVGIEGETEAGANSQNT